MIEADRGAFEAGLAAANNPADPAKEMRTQLFVKGWLEEIDRVRQYDEDAYKQLAKDRAYAAGHSPFESKTNVIGSYIDTWHSLLYARDPDIDVMPRKLLEKAVILTPEQEMQKQMAAAIGMQIPDPPDPALKLQQDAIDIAKTMSMVIAEQWSRARFKDQADPWTRAALTSKRGWLKLTWQAGGASDPVTARPLQDLRDNLARLDAEIREMEEGTCGDLEMQRAQLELTIAAVEKSTEVEIARGLCVDAVDMADITVSDAVPTIGRYLESPWISHRIYKPWKDAVGMFPDVPLEKMKAAATFSPKKAKANEKGAGLSEYSAADANTYGEHTEGGKYICIEEVWSMNDGQILTFIRGVDQMAREPYSPPTSRRFYGFFDLSFSEVDGTRWGQSLNERSQPIQDEYDRANTGLRTHRARIKPGMIFNKAALNEASANALTKAQTAEFVGLDMMNPKADIRSAITPKQYPPIDIALYSTEPLMARFELVWGLQEAMTATLDTAKTATEAEIQQSGTMARTGAKRDILEDKLTDAARYTAELCLNPDTGLTQEEVIAVVGPNALWPLGLTPAQIQQLASVEIRAGSSGKPNTKAMRETWAEILPMLVQGIEKIGFLRQSTPEEMASCYEELMRETVDRSGERIDVTRFIPLAGAPQPMGMPGTPGPGGLPVPAPAEADGTAAPDGAPPADPNYPVPRTA